jgi:hypothetical protein
MIAWKAKVQVEWLKHVMLSPEAHLKIPKTFVFRTALYSRTLCYPTPRTGQLNEVSLAFVPIEKRQHRNGVSRPMVAETEFHLAYWTISYRNSGAKRAINFQARIIWIPATQNGLREKLRLSRLGILLPIMGGLMARSRVGVQRVPFHVAIILAELNLIRKPDRKPHQR